MELIGSGRNVSYKEIHNNKYFFKKKLLGQKEDVFRRYNNLLKWDRVLEGAIDVNSLKITNSDSNDFTLQYEWIENAESLQGLLSEAVDNMDELVNKAAVILAKIHLLPDEKNGSEIHRQNWYRPVLALEIEEYANCTGAELELFSLLQHDDELLNALFNHYNDKENMMGMCHGDIRLDQFLYDGEKVWIIDFEEFHYGDILRDLAGLIGCIFFEALLKTFSSSIQDSSEPKEIDKDFVERGKTYLDNCESVMHSAFKAYQDTVSYKVDKKRLVINIGWFVIERIMSRAKFSFRLSAMDKAILGVGRQAILYPEYMQDLFDTK
ncbi:phosphotransferase [Bacillus velezensis]|uniref:phosphotransferase n=1 Tax=Bacillus velezensis TaxID=492670 RepID=UPI00207980A2|nr:phosphotransferase [Bacillus velezensis]USK17601.1 aminoglycoside phosphotransferase family protein [Bacillus velezensis]USK21401.1 aminoglycoside phosphotransferase family protein [Bacillus velezensis]